MVFRSHWTIARISIGHTVRVRGPIQGVNKAENGTNLSRRSNYDLLKKSKLAVQEAGKTGQICPVLAAIRMRGGRRVPTPPIPYYGARQRLPGAGKGTNPAKILRNIDLGAQEILLCWCHSTFVYFLTGVDTV